MRGLMWNCKKVNCTYPDDKNELSAQDCLLVYLCCEGGDSIKQSREVVRRIIQLNKKRFMKDKLVIFPFAHLSDNILDKDSAKALINVVVTRLEKKMQVLIMGFDQKKEVKIHLLPENKDVSYFSY